MNTYISLACLMAVLGLSQGNPIGSYGYGTPWIGHAPLYVPSAVSTANLVKAAPVPVIRTQIVPVITSPIVTTGYGWGNFGLGKGLGWSGLGWGGQGVWGGYGGWGDYGGWGGHGVWGGYGGYGKH